MHFGLIFFFIVLLVAFDAKQLNNFASNLNKNIQEQYENIMADKPDLASSKPEPTTLEQTNNTLKDINQTYKDSKEKVKQTKQEISQGVKDIKDKARRFTRGLPRSEKEANKMFIAFAEKYFGSWRTKFNGLKRQNAGSSKAGKSLKLSENRLKR